MECSTEADAERRFGGLRRLYGDAGYRRLREATLVVVGVGGVGSWTVEALARCGVARLVLIDLDQVSESNINRQIQALEPTLGLAKVEALRSRIALIHPGCEVLCVEDFVGADNWPQCVPVAMGTVDGVIDCCDQSVAKRTLMEWALRAQRSLVSVGAAGGKREPQRVTVADLTETSHDPLLAGLRQRLRREGLVPRHGRSGLTCVFSTEAVARPVRSCETGEGRSSDLAGGAPLACAGYGSTVTVTATFGMVAANVAVEQILKKSG